MTDHIYVALARSLDLLAAERIERCALAHQPLDGTDAVSLCRSLGISEQLLDGSLDGLQVDGAIFVEFHGLIESLQLILLLVDVILDTGLHTDKLCGYDGVVLLDSGLHLIEASLYSGNLVTQAHIGSLIGYELRIGGLCISEKLLDSCLDGLQVDGAILVELHGFILSLQLCLLLVDITLDCASASANCAATLA